MADTFKAVQVSEHVYWVGAVDWAVRDFHGYLTGRGSTYNAYLVLADKVTLIDTVKAPFKDEMLARVASVIDPGRTNYIVSNHAEADHSGGLPAVIDRVKPERVFASAMGVKALNAQYHLDAEITAVTDGESLNLGNMNLTCVETRMVHWPDSMVTYLDADEVLFSQDAFGMHLASAERFADQVDGAVLAEEAATYYANIVMPHSRMVAKVLDKVTGLGIPIKTVAPDHGPIWRTAQDIRKVLSWYGMWARGVVACKAAVVYDTMWNNTALMARAIGEGLAAGGVDVRVLPLRAAHRTGAATELLDAGALVVGSPTLNNNLFPTVADFLAYARGLKPRIPVGASFGSYGWSGEAVGMINDVLKSMKAELVGEGIKVNYTPDAGALGECHALGGRIADRLKQVCSRRGLESA